MTDPRAAMKAFSEHYDYDVSYMERILALSPTAFEAFQQLAALSGHREAVPAVAHFTAKLVGVLTEDCGPCVQLVVKMAREGGMTAEQVTAVLTADEAAMDRETLLAYRFATAMASRSPEVDAARGAVAAAWGEAAVLDLTFGLQFSRVYPMIKLGLGFAKTCQRVEVDERPVDVVPRAA